MLIVPILDLGVTRAENCALGADIMISALGNNAPKCLAVGILALLNIEHKAYLLNDIVFAVIIGQSGVKIGQCAGKVYKLITAHFVKLESAANLFGDYARRLADALKVSGTPV